MLASGIWSGAFTASDIFLLVAAVVAGLDAVAHLAASDNAGRTLALLPAAVCLVALGLLAL